jgi:hypothetical protein
MEEESFGRKKRSKLKLWYIIPILFGLALTFLALYKKSEPTYQTIECWNEYRVTHCNVMWTSEEKKEVCYNETIQVCKEGICENKTVEVKEYVRYCKDGKGSGIAIETTNYTEIIEFYEKYQEDCDKYGGGGSINIIEETKQICTQCRNSLTKQPMEC